MSGRLSSEDQLRLVLFNQYKFHFVDVARAAMAQGIPINDLLVLGISGEDSDWRTWGSMFEYFAAIYHQPYRQTLEYPLAIVSAQVSKGKGMLADMIPGILGFIAGVVDDHSFVRTAVLLRGGCTLVRMPLP